MIENVPVGQQLKDGHVNKSVPVGQQLKDGQWACEQPCTIWLGVEGKRVVEAGCALGQVTANESEMKDWFKIGCDSWLAVGV